MLKIRQPISDNKAKIIGCFAFLVIILIYSYLSYRQHQINPHDQVIPNYSQFIAGIKKITTPDANGNIWLLRDLKATFTKYFLGLTVGVILSLIVGIAMGCWSTIAAFFEPLLSFFAQIPPTAMIAVYFVIFGFNLNMYIAIIALGIFPTLAQTVYYSVIHDVKENAIYRAFSLGGSTDEIIGHVIFRQILPRFIGAIILTVGPALVFLIAAELLLADVGFGYTLRVQSRIPNMSVVYLYLIILGIIGKTITWSLNKIQRLLCPWFVKGQ